LNHQLHWNERETERGKGKGRRRGVGTGELSTGTITFTVIFNATLELGARIKKMGTRSSQCVRVSVCVRVSNKESKILLYKI